MDRSGARGQLGSGRVSLDRDMMVEDLESARALMINRYHSFHEVTSLLLDALIDRVRRSEFEASFIQARDILLQFLHLFVFHFKTKEDPRGEIDYLKRLGSFLLGEGNGTLGCRVFTSPLANVFSTKDAGLLMQVAIRALEQRASFSDVYASVAPVSSCSWRKNPTDRGVLGLLAGENQERAPRESAAIEDRSDRSQSSLLTPTHAHVPEPDRSIVQAYAPTLGGSLRFRDDLINSKDLVPLFSRDGLDATQWIVESIDHVLLGHRANRQGDGRVTIVDGANMFYLMTDRPQFYWADPEQVAHELDEIPSTSLIVVVMKQESHGINKRYIPYETILRKHRHFIRVVVHMPRCSEVATWGYPCLEVKRNPHVCSIHGQQRESGTVTVRHQTRLRTQPRSWSGLSGPNVGNDTLARVLGEGGDEYGSPMLHVQIDSTQKKGWIYKVDSTDNISTSSPLKKIYCEYDDVLMTLLARAITARAPPHTRFGERQVCDIVSKELGIYKPLEDFSGLPPALIPKVNLSVSYVSTA